MVLGKVYNLYMEFVFLVCFKLEWDGDGGIWSYGNMCVFIKNEVGFCYRNIFILYLDFGYFCF